MTVTQVTSLIMSFESNVELAMSFVLKMNAEEKIKAVQFWNLMSEKLQEIVNSNAADINAVALKMNELEKETVNEEQFYVITAQNCNSNTVNYEESAEEESCSISDEVAKDEYHKNEIARVNLVNDSVLSVSKLYSSPDDTSQSGAENELPETTKNSTIARKCNDLEEAQHKVKNSLKQRGAVSVLKSVSKFQSSQHLSTTKTATPSTSTVMHEFETRKSKRLKKRKRKGFGDVTKDFDEDCDDPGSCKNFRDQCTKGEASDGKARPCPCSLCNIRFENVEELEASFDNSVQEKLFPCTHCSSVFSSSGNLKVHMRSHTGERPYPCHQCDRSFQTKGNMLRHLASHSGNKPWKCDQCDGCFTEKGSLIVHMRRHTGEKPFECKECGKRFSQSAVLQSHMSIHSSERRYVCDLCGKSFKVKNQLSVHQLRHESVRKFACGICPAQFVTNGDLGRHRRRHTGEKPFVCDVCGKSFTRKIAMKEHLNRNICGKGSADSISNRKRTKENGNKRKPKKTKKDLSTTEAPGASQDVTLATLELPQYFTVVIDSKQCVSAGQSILINQIPVNGGEVIASDSYRVLSTFNVVGGDQNFT